MGNEINASGGQARRPIAPITVSRQAAASGFQYASQ
jgi:hypothetical protein